MTVFVVLCRLLSKALLVIGVPLRQKIAMKVLFWFVTLCSTQCRPETKVRLTIVAEETVDIGFIRDQFLILQNPKIFVSSVLITNFPHRRHHPSFLYLFTQFSPIE